MIGFLPLFNAAYRYKAGVKQGKLAEKINPVFNQYQASPYANQRMGLAKQLFAGRMFGAPQLERNIFSNQANTLNNVNKVSTDASQALAYGAAAQGQTDESLTDLQTAEAQNKYSMLGNLNNAYSGMINEGDKEYDSMRYKYEQDAAQKNALTDASMNNKYGALNDVYGYVMQAANMALGQFGGMGGGNSGGGNSSGIASGVSQRFGGADSTGIRGRYTNQGSGGSADIYAGLRRYFKRGR